MQAIKVSKKAMFVMRVPWAIKTDNCSVYTSQGFMDFLQNFKIKQSTGITYNPQGQAIMERIKNSLKG